MIYHIDVIKEYTPCLHPGTESCKDINCPCSVRGFCEKHCVCNKDLCKLRFQGCRCEKNKCSDNTCPCFANGRECDKTICRSIKYII